MQENKRACFFLKHGVVGYELGFCLPSCIPWSANFWNCSNCWFSQWTQLLSKPAMTLKYHVPKQLSVTWKTERLTLCSGQKLDMTVRVPILCNHHSSSVEYSDEYFGSTLTTIECCLSVENVFCLHKLQQSLLSINLYLTISGAVLG